MTDKKMYTQEQVDLIVVQTKQDGMLGQIARLEERVDRNYSELREEIRSNFHWILGSQIGLYVLAIGSLLGMVGKAYKWF